MTATSLISADSHYVEPPEMWAERIDAAFRDRAPRDLRGSGGVKGEALVCEDLPPHPTGSVFLAGQRDPEIITEALDRGFEVAPPFVRDPAARLDAQDADEVAVEVMYTTFGLDLYRLSDAELQAACFRAFNDWAADYCSYDPSRLVGVALLPMHDVGAAVAELERVANKPGLRGAMIWSEPPADRPYHLAEWDPLWAAAQEAYVPLSLHVLTGQSSLNFAGGNIVYSGSMLFQDAQRTIATFVLEGILDRFPRLRIVSCEKDVAWMSYLADRMDGVYRKLHKRSSTQLSALPSEILRRQVYASLTDEAMFVQAFEIFPPDNVLWCSDFPHLSSTWPDSISWIDKIFGGVCDEDRRKMVHDNALRLYFS